MSPIRYIQWLVMVYWFEFLGFFGEIAYRIKDGRIVRRCEKEGHDWLDCGYRLASGTSHYCEELDGWLEGEGWQYLCARCHRMAFPCDPRVTSSRPRYEK